MEFYDVIIIGAGLSGVGTACRIKEKLPLKSFLILEARSNIGGTWDLFRYPGVRSDSDMATMGYSFRPWTSNDYIGKGEDILEYIKQTANEYHIEQQIKFNSKLVSTSWSSTEKVWTLKVSHFNDEKTYKCRFLSLCGGYYRFDQGHNPSFPGSENFQGPILHPQFWPENIDYRNKNVVVIGSGATAMTIVPNISDQAKHVTMLQRSPTYIISLPSIDFIGKFVGIFLPKNLLAKFIRWKNIKIQKWVYSLARKYPKTMKSFLVNSVRRNIGKKIDVDKHFNPNYDPWDQRLCLIPDGDLYDSINKEKVNVITDHIECFTENGIRLRSKEEIKADIIVTATGIEAAFYPGVQITIDGQDLQLADCITYKGMMFAGVPNLVLTFGYTNASWTLRLEIIADWTCRLLSEMDLKESQICVPELLDSERKMPLKPFITDFTPNYVLRTQAQMPKQGDHWPWQNLQNYQLEKKLISHSPLEDKNLRFQ